MTRPKKAARPDANRRDAKSTAVRLFDDELDDSPESLLDDMPTRYRDRFAEIVARIDEFATGI